MQLYSAVYVLLNKVIWRPLNRNSMHMHEKKAANIIRNIFFLVPYKSRQMKRFVSNAECDQEVEKICVRKKNF